MWAPSRPLVWIVLLLLAAWVAWGSRDLREVDDADLRVRANATAPPNSAWDALLTAGADPERDPVAWARDVEAILASSEALWIPVPDLDDERPVARWAFRAQALGERGSWLERDGELTRVVEATATLTRLAARLEQATGAAVIELLTATSIQEVANGLVEAWLDRGVLSPDEIRTLSVAFERGGLRGDRWPAAWAAEYEEAVALLDVGQEIAAERAEGLEAMVTTTTNYFHHPKRTRQLIAERSRRFGEAYSTACAEELPTLEPRPIRWWTYVAPNALGEILSALSWVDVRRTRERLCAELERSAALRKRLAEAAAATAAAG